MKSRAISKNAGHNRMLSALNRAICVLAFGVITNCAALAQEGAGQGLPQLIGANERFGRKLLRQVHSASPDKNVVVSPISLTVVFAALQANTYQEQDLKEIGEAFGWGAYPRLSVPTRMLLAAFEEPGPRVLARPNAIPAGGGGSGGPEAAWITNTFLYRTPEDVKEPISLEFMRDAQKYFGMRFVSTGRLPPTKTDLARARKSLGPVPQIPAANDVWINSGTHLQTGWKGNTFSMSEPHQEEFLTSSGQSRQVKMVTSELSVYRYAKTDGFEAVALPCNSGYMVAVLPAPGKEIHDLERDLAEHPELLDAVLKLQIGKVTLPYFRFGFESDLRESLQAMGIKQVFEDLGRIISIPKSHLTRVSQKVEIEVNRQGIRANAETVGGIVYAGIMGGMNPFHVQLNRPFIFLIREQNTNALLFLGAVMDPNQN